MRYIRSKFMQESEEGQFLQSPERAEFWNKGFEIASISREDLIKAGYAREIVRLLTEADMTELADQMGDAYTDTGYWEDLETAATAAFAEKGGEVLRGSPALVGFVGEDGKLISFTSLGGYPIYYLDTENSILCAACANEPDEIFKIVAGDAYMEGGDLECEGCGSLIKSAYDGPEEKLQE